MPEFVPERNKPDLSPGLVLRIGDRQPRFLMLTHVFGDSVYVMWVEEAEQARYARHPQQKSYYELDKLATEPGSAWGRLKLPPALRRCPAKGTEQAAMLEAAWALIAPLIELFDSESNLSRSSFTALIRQRAKAKNVHFQSLRRLLLRYYYFGRTPLALLSLIRGVKPGSKRSTAFSKGPHAARRRGRKPAVPRELRRKNVKPNDFVISEADIDDMVRCLKSCAKRPTTVSIAYEKYLKKEFKRRHPQVFEEYASSNRMVPVSLRQFRYYTAQAQLDEALAKNLRPYARGERYSGALQASGPAELYEIDSTGGRINLVSMDDPPVLLRTPWIYLLIDRWSRYVPAVYITLNSPSYEEVRYVLLIAFTSRERFKVLGIDVDDGRWEPGIMPLVVCPDRGPDVKNVCVVNAAVENLRMEVTPLPPFHPDAKAIIERFIRELKRRMSQSGLKGVYAERPIDPLTKKAARKARTAAVHSLVEAYRVLIEIVIDHNNRSHPVLKKRLRLAQAGVRPTPREAYFWGLNNITGLRRPGYTDEEYYEFLRSVDDASIANGIVIYKGRLYEPENELAHELAARSTKRRRRIKVHVDKTFPYTVDVQTSRGEWARFRINSAGADELAGITLQESEVLKPLAAELSADSDDRALRDRITTRKAPQRSQKRKQPVVEVSREEQRELRKRETTNLKLSLSGHGSGAYSTGPIPADAGSDWEKRQGTERNRKQELIRQHWERKRTA